MWGVACLLTHNDGVCVCVLQGAVQGQSTTSSTLGLWSVTDSLCPLSLLRQGTSVTLMLLLIAGTILRVRSKSQYYMYQQIM